MEPGNTGTPAEESKTGLAEAPTVVIEGAPPKALGPVQPEERIALIDVLRGLALFGIIVANIRGFAGPRAAYFRPSLLWQTPSDFWVQAFVDTFIQGKFITLFAFLFGVGFALQFARADARGSRFGPIYRRRLEALILIGGLHQLFFWWGDILVTYGVGGFLLMLFRKRKNKTILIWVLALMLGPCVGMSGFVLFRHFRPQSPQKVEQAQKKAAEAKQKDAVELRKAIEVYQTGNYAEIFRRRLQELGREGAAQFGAVMLTLPLFLLGLWVYRQGIFQDPGGHREWLKRGLVLGLTIGIPVNIIATWLQRIAEEQQSAGGPTPVMVAMVTLSFFGRPLLSMGYACALALLFLNEGWRRRMTPFGAIGRTALSNYLLQTVIGTTIFYGYGGGLFGRAHLAWLMPLAVAIYALEAPLSQWWLKRYRFGPVEWAWRAMTYGKRPEMTV